MTTTDLDDTTRFDDRDLAFLHAEAWIMAHESDLDAALAQCEDRDAHNHAWQIRFDMMALRYATVKGAEIARARIVANVGEMREWAK